MALGNFLLALAGFLTFYIEAFRPEIIEMADNIAKRENITPPEAIQKAQKTKKRERLAMLIPWSIGILLIGIGLIIS